MELITDPSGAYLLFLFGFSGLACLLIESLRRHYLELTILVPSTFGLAVLVAALFDPDIGAAVVIVGLFLVAVLGTRRFLNSRGHFLLVALILYFCAIGLFVFRAVMTTFFGKG